jgi:hypothetical protein
MAKSGLDQGIIRTQRGEEQPADKDRAQKVHRSTGKNSSTREETRKEASDKPARSGRSS